MRKTLRKILIVDDHEDTLRLYGSVLLRNGYEVAITRNGEEALQWMEQSPPNLVVLDVMMPGLNRGSTGGRSVGGSKIPLPQGSVIVLIVSSGVRRDGALEQLASECGAVEVIPKPLTPQELLAKIKTYLNDPPSRHVA